MATVPPVPVTPTTIDWNKVADDIINNRSGNRPVTTTSTTIPSGTASDGGSIFTTPVAKLKLSEELDKSISTAKSNVSNKNFTTAIDVAKGTKKAPGGGGIKGFLGKVALGALDYGVLKPLQTIDVGRRVVLSTVREGIDVFGSGDASFKDFYKQATDVTLDPKKLFNYPKFGNKFLDGTIGFIIDVGADPLTYLTLGTGTAAKIGLQSLVKTVGKEAVEKIAREAAEDLATKSVKEVNEIVTKKLIKELGESGNKKVIRQGAAATVADAAQVAKRADVVIPGIDAKLAQATRKWATVAPRKQLGLNARTSTAQSIKQLRDDALQEASEFAGKAQGRRAAAFANTMSDEVIETISRRGVGGLSDDVLEELGITGGLRWGLGKAKVSLGTPSNAVTRNVGNLLSKTRLGTMNIGGGKGSPGLARLITGANVPEAVYDAKVALRAGLFKSSPEDAVLALEKIAKSTQIAGLRKTAPVVKAALARTLTKENTKYKNTVYELLESGVDLTKSLDEIATVVKRPVVQAEVDFANNITKFFDDFATVSDTRVGQTLTQGAVKFLSRPQGKPVYEALGFVKPPLPGENIGRQLTADIPFFGQKVVNLDGSFKTIKELNQIAKDFGGFKGDFFETNIERTLSRYANRFSDNFGLIQAIDEETATALNTGGVNWGVGYKPALIGGEISKIAPSVPLRPSMASRLQPAEADEVYEALREMGLPDLDNILSALTAKARRIETSGSLSASARDSANEAVDELKQIVFNLRQALANKDDIATAWGALAVDGAAQYATLLSLNPKRIVKFIDDLKPNDLKTMVKLAEDVFIALDTHVMPDAFVKAELATIYSNVNKLKNINERNLFLRGLNNYNQSVKIWYTGTVGFHTRNIISNYFQMLAGGGNLRYMSRGIKYSNQWNDYLQKYPPKITTVFPGSPSGAEGFSDLDLTIKDFFTKKNIPKADQNAVSEALKYNGGAGFGDLEEISVGLSGKLGITGREATGRIPGTNIKVPGAQKASEIVGFIPTKSRSFGNKIEDQSRFVFTFDGVKQGLTAQESVARTSKFLVDYSDLSSLDQVAKQFIPFWMWMSRNLPNQFVNMYSNPAIYQKYNAARRNYENSDGTSVLSPNYIMKGLTPQFVKDTGATVIGQIAGVGGITLKPDFGFPGSGSPSPLQQGVTDFDSLLSSLTPGARGILEQIAGKEFFSKQKLEGAGERTKSAVETAIPQLSTLSRLLNTVAAGTDNPVLRNVPGIYSSTTASGKTKDTSDNLKKIQALLSYLGVPVGVVGGNEQNVARYDILRELEKLKDK